jgi:hypothetical protein
MIENARFEATESDFVDISVIQHHRENEQPSGAKWALEARASAHDEATPRQGCELNDDRLRGRPSRAHRK